MNLLTLEEAATVLGISKASVKNWEKHGYLKTLHNKMYSPVDVEDLKDKISTGEIKRLGSRANKSSSKNQFIPLEYVNNSDSIELLEKIVLFVLEYNIKPEQALFLLSVNALVKVGDIEKELVYEALKFSDSSLFKRKSIYNELKSWFSIIHKGEIKSDNRFCKFLLEVELPDENDFLGIIYQSIMHEGKKSKLGSYYTPTSVVKRIVEDNLTDGKVLDPCCGTGQFLMVMATKIEDPRLIWGADIDNIAVRITRINLMLHYITEDFSPNIYNHNSLLELDEGGFSFIATNPPWGAKFDKKNLVLLKDKYPEIDSSESFSFFLSFALKYLKSDGIYSFVLPESILYVKNHQDIRSHLLNNSSISYIESSGRLFKNVFSSVIRVDGKNTPLRSDTEVKIKVDKTQYNINQSRFLSNQNRIIDIYCSNDDQEIIDMVYAYPHSFLKNQATWALGIVTGNNSLHVSSIYKDGMEPLFRGKELGKMELLAPSSYIQFDSKLYQQCAPVEIYRADEKLIYKFINKDLVFAYDDKKQLTLNSANILIPQIDGFPVKAVGALLNSSLYRFIFRKKFNAIKVLRGDIESLPIPNLDPSQINELITLVDNYLKGDIKYKTIDEYVLNIFDIDISWFNKFNL